MGHLLTLSDLDAGLMVCFDLIGAKLADVAYVQNTTAWVHQYGAMLLTCPSAQSGKDAGWLIRIHTMLDSLGGLD